MFQHRTVKSFWKAYDALPKSIQKIADKQFVNLANNPKYPSLYFKNFKGKQWSARVTDNYRALGMEVGDTLL